MAKQLSKAGIAEGSIVEAHHVTQSIDAFTGDIAYDITLSGSYTLTGSMYTTDTIFSNNFQASSALTFTGGSNDSKIISDKDGSNYFKFRDSTGTTDRGLLGFSSNLLLISNNGTGGIGLYSNGSAALSIDSSQNVNIPNGGLTVKNSGISSQIELHKNDSSRIEWRDAGDSGTRGYIGYAVAGVDSFVLYNGEAKPMKIYNNGSKTLEIDTSQNVTFEGTLNGDGSGLTNVTSTGGTGTYNGTFIGNGSGLTNINGDNVSKVSNAAHADTAGSANSVDGENVNGAVANATYATTAGSAPWNGTLENTEATITNNNSNTGFLLFKDSDYATIDIPAPSFQNPNSTPTTTYTADSWIRWQGRTKTIDRTMSPGGIESYSGYEDKFRMGIDTQGRFRIVRGTSWTGLRIERDSSKIIIDQGLTVSAGGSTITGTSTLNGKTTINHSDGRPLTIHRTTVGSNNDDEVVIAFNSPDDTEGAIIGIDKTSNGGGVKLQESSTWKKIYVRDTGGGITTNFTTSGKLTVSSGGAEINGSSSVLKLNSTSGANFIEFFTSDKSTRMGYVGDGSSDADSENITLSKDGGAAITLGASSANINKKLTVTNGGGARIDGNSNFEDNLTIGYGAANYSSTNVTFTATSEAPEKHILKSFYRASATAGSGATAAKELKSDQTSTDSGTNYAKLAVNGTIKADGYFGTSDERLKTLIGNYNPGEALNTLNKITPKLFKWNELSHASGLTDFGFFAQEVEEVFPFGVVTSKTDNFEDQRSINPIAMVALASAAIKDLSKENEILKDRNRELEDRLKLIEEKLGL